MGTQDEFTQIIARCKAVFTEKMEAYGTAWRILRLSSLTDQLLIKARRIRRLQEVRRQAVSDSVELEFVGIVNYALIALMQQRLGVAASPAAAGLAADKADAAYEAEVQAVRTLLAAKNHDYDEAWRDMRPSALTDQVLMKILRLRSLETKADPAPEVLRSIYQDVVNYAVFALIQSPSLPTTDKRTKASAHN